MRKSCLHQTVLISSSGSVHPHLVVVKQRPGTVVPCARELLGHKGFPRHFQTLPQLFHVGLAIGKSGYTTKGSDVERARGPSLLFDGRICEIGEGRSRRDVERHGYLSICAVFSLRHGYQGRPGVLAWKGNSIIILSIAKIIEFIQSSFNVVFASTRDVDSKPATGFVSTLLKVLVFFGDCELRTILLMAKVCSPTLHRAQWPEKQSREKRHKNLPLHSVVSDTQLWLLWLKPQGVCHLSS